MLKRTVSSVTVFLITLITSTIQADDVSISNPSQAPKRYRVVIPSTGFDKTITLKPGESQNAIGTDLWHNAFVKIYGMYHGTSSKVDCLLLITEKELPNLLFKEPFYLPEVTGTAHHPPCEYSINTPSDCDCFTASLGGSCLDDCRDVSNAQVIVEDQESSAASW